MNPSLRDAADQGSIDALYASIQMDPEVLDRIDKIPFVETPLHIVASAGHTLFAMEIMKLKPSFARKLNQDGFTPLHLALQKLRALENDQALQKKQTQLVYRLVSVDKDLIRVQGREGVTPLHYVAQIGNLHLLTKFLKDCPTSVEDVTIRGENVLHIALKNNMPELEAFSYLLRRVLGSYLKDAKLLEEKLLYCTDDEGNTLSLLEVAVSIINQPEVMQWILHNESIVLRLLMNMRSDQRKNLESQTSTLQVDNPRIKDMLRPRGTARLKHHFNSFSVWAAEGYFLVELRRQQTLITERRRNALLVVAALLITVTYPVAFSPDQPNEFNCTVPNPFNGTGANHFNCTARFNPSSEVNPPRDQYSVIVHSLNAYVFLLTNITLFYLVPFDFLGWLLTLLVGLLFLCYCLSTPLLSKSLISAQFYFYSEIYLTALVPFNFLYNYLAKFKKRIQNLGW